MEKNNKNSSSVRLNYKNICVDEAAVIGKQVVLTVTTKNSTEQNAINCLKQLSYLRQVRTYSDSSNYISNFNLNEIISDWIFNFEIAHFYGNRRAQNMYTYERNKYKI